MRHPVRTLEIVALAALAGSLGCTAGAEPLSVQRQALSTPIAPVLTTTPLPNYEDAPRTPDVDDPAIWKPSRPGQKPLVIGTLKNGGLQVFDLSGRVLQTISPANRPAISAEDPPAPGVKPEAATSACPESLSGETFGRYNNVDISYGFKLRDAWGFKRRVDLAVVSDRGCDRLHFYVIDPARPGGPLFDVTAANTPRLFPERLMRPSPVQSPGEPNRVEPNPLDDQDTTYGMTLAGEGNDLQVVVSQEHRNTLALVDLRVTASGKISYRKRAQLHFPTIHKIPAPTGSGTIDWTPCREEAFEDLQFEGLVVDQENQVLYASQEVVGVWAIELDDDLEGDIEVSPDHLIEKVKSFGEPFYAIPDDDEFECESELPEDAPEGTVFGPGTPGVGGANVEADVEGMTIYYADGEPTYLIVSSQGSSSFQVFEGLGCGDGLDHIGEFQIDGVGSTDGLQVESANLGGRFRRGLLVVQNGYEYDGSSQLVFVKWADVARSFSPPLEIDP